MIIDKIKEIVKLYPDRVAYTVDNESITYENLWNNATKYSKFLKNEGTSPIIIYGNKEINMIISILSCLLAKRAYIPIGTCMPTSRINSIIKMTNASLILTDYEINIPNIKISKITDLSRAPIKEEDNLNNTSYIIFTSGSTGEPKGVPISYNNLDNFITWISNIYPLSNYHNINVLNTASFSFDLSVADLYYSLCNGHTLFATNNSCSCNYFNIFITLKDINLIVCTPTYIKLCLLDSSFNGQNYPNLKCIYFCGEQLEINLVKKLYLLFPNIDIINAYGPTEATSAVSAIKINREMLNEDILPVGNINNLAVNIEIINNEIVLKGKSVFDGYLNITTDNVYKENGINCYKTGDLGYIRNNMLYITGRKDNQIKYKGYRIELHDIENNILQIKDVIDCAVIAKYDENNIVKTLKAYIVSKNKNSNYIKEKLKTMLPNYMIPKSIVILDKLPVNLNGKIDRKALSKL